MNKPQRITKPIDFLYRRFNRCWTVEDMNTVSRLIVKEAERVVETESAQEANRVLNIMLAKNVRPLDIYRWVAMAFLPSPKLHMDTLWTLLWTRIKELLDDVSSYYMDTPWTHLVKIKPYKR